MMTTILRSLASLAMVAALSAPATALASVKTDVAKLKACIAKPSANVADCIGTIANPCEDEDGGSSTQGIDACLGREADAWDAILNQNYAAALAEAKETDANRKAEGDEDASAAAQLQKAQRAWVAFRDAECDRRFELAKDGTIRTNIASSCLLDLTAMRAVDLAADEP